MQSIATRRCLEIKIVGNYRILTMCPKIIQKILLVIVIQFILGNTRSYSQSIIKLASDDWCPYVCVDNGRITGGFLVEATAQAMQLSGFQIEPVLVPFTRAIDQTVDGYIQGVFSPPGDSRLSMSRPMFYARSCFYTLNDQSWTYHGLKSLEQITVGVIPDYNYDDGAFDAYVEQNRRKNGRVDLAYGEYAGINNLKKLLATRFAALVEDEAVIHFLARKINVENRIKQVGCLENPIAVVIGFSKKDKHSQGWIRALSSGMQQLEASGKLQALRQRYQIPLIPPPEKSH
ncbi:polar amino acid transport system substrate-binding protein [Oxalobacteraceae bacterium GrIS 2.11]